MKYVGNIEIMFKVIRTQLCPLAPPLVISCRFPCMCHHKFTDLTLFFTFIFLLNIDVSVRFS